MFTRIATIFMMFCVFASTAWATLDHINTPLMVIRFNQPRVYYEQPLYNALNRAAQAKTGVRFAIINYFPANPQGQRIAEANFQRVLATIRQIGVPNQRVDIRNEAAPDLNYSEVHIYVR
jgi:hypothetical protein